MNNSDDAIMALGTFFIGLAVLIVVGALAFLVYCLVVALAAYMRYRRFRELGYAEFDRLAGAVGYDLEADEVLSAMGYELPVDSTGGAFVDALFGREEEVA